MVKTRSSKSKASDVTPPPDQKDSGSVKGTKTYSPNKSREKVKSSFNETIRKRQSDLNQNIKNVDNSSKERTSPKSSKSLVPNIKLSFPKFHSPVLRSGSIQYASSAINNTVKTVRKTRTTSNSQKKVINSFNEGTRKRQRYLKQNVKNVTNNSKERTSPKSPKLLKSSKSPVPSNKQSSPKFNTPILRSSNSETSSALNITEENVVKETRTTRSSGCHVITTHGQKYRRSTKRTKTPESNSVKYNSLKKLNKTSFDGTTGKNQSPKNALNKSKECTTAKQIKSLKSLVPDNKQFSPKSILRKSNTQDYLNANNKILRSAFKNVQNSAISDEKVSSSNKKTPKFNNECTSNDDQKRHNKPRKVLFSVSPQLGVKNARKKTVRKRASVITKKDIPKNLKRNKMQFKELYVSCNRLSPRTIKYQIDNRKLEENKLATKTIKKKAATERSNKSKKTNAVDRLNDSIQSAEVEKKSTKRRGTETKHNLINDEVDTQDEMFSNILARVPLSKSFEESVEDSLFRSETHDDAPSMNVTENIKYITSEKRFLKSPSWLYTDTLHCHQKQTKIFEHNTATGTKLHHEEHSETVSAQDKIFSVALIKADKCLHLNNSTQDSFCSDDIETDAEKDELSTTNEMEDEGNQSNTSKSKNHLTTPDLRNEQSYTSASIANADVERNKNVCVQSPSWLHKYHIENDNTLSLESKLDETPESELTDDDEIRTWCSIS